MRWFEHQADAAENKKIRKIEAWGTRLNPEYGAMAAVGWYFRLLEVIAGHGQLFRLPDDYGIDLLAQDLRTTEEIAVSFLDFLAEIKAIDMEAWKTRVVFCPKLAARAARYTDELIKSRAGEIAQSGKSISYELFRIIESLAVHPDKRKRTYYAALLHRICAETGQRPDQDDPGSAHSLRRACAEAVQNMGSGCTENCPPSQSQSPSKQPSGCVVAPATPVDDASPEPVEKFPGEDEGQGTAKSGPRFGPSGLVELWNEMGCRPMVSELTEERRKKAGLRLRKRDDRDWWERLFKKVKELNKPWLTFDFLMRSDTNCLKVLEGNYDHDFGSRNNGGRRQAGPGCYQKPHPADHGKFASRSRILSTDPGGGGTDPEKDSPGQGGVSGAPERPAV